MPTAAEFHPINVVATRESGALRRNGAWLEAPENRAALDGQIAPGFQPSAQYDLSFFGGPTIATGTVQPVYVVRSAGKKRSGARATREPRTTPYTGRRVAARCRCWA